MPPSLFLPVCSVATGFEANAVITARLLGADLARDQLKSENANCVVEVFDPLSREAVVNCTRLRIGQTDVHLSASKDGECCLQLKPPSADCCSPNALLLMLRC